MGKVCRKDDQAAVCRRGRPRERLWFELTFVANLTSFENGTNTTTLIATHPAETPSKADMMKMSGGAGTVAPEQGLQAQAQAWAAAVGGGHDQHARTRRRILCGLGGHVLADPPRPFRSFFWSHRWPHRGAVDDAVQLTVTEYTDSSAAAAAPSSSNPTRRRNPCSCTSVVTAGARQHHYQFCDMSTSPRRIAQSCIRSDDCSGSGIPQQGSCHQDDPSAGTYRAPTCGDVAHPGLVSTTQHSTSDRSDAGVTTLSYAYDAYTEQLQRMHHHLRRNPPATSLAT